MNKYFLYGVRKLPGQLYGYRGITVVCEDHLRRAFEGYIDDMGGRIFDAKDLPEWDKYECEECSEDERHYNSNPPVGGYLGDAQRAELADELMRLTIGNEIVRLQRMASRTAEGLAWVVAAFGGFELVDHLLPHIAPESWIGGLSLVFVAFIASRVFKRWMAKGRSSNFLEHMFPGMTDSEVRRLRSFRAR